MPGRILRKILVHLVMVKAQSMGQRAVAFLREHVGIQPGDVDRVALHETEIDRIGVAASDPSGKAGMGGVVDADIQHRSRTAPIRHHGRGAHADKPVAGLEQGRQPGQAAAAPRGNGLDRRGRNGEASRNRQIHSHQTLQAFGAPAVPHPLDLGRGCDFQQIGAVAHVHGRAG